MHKFVVEVDGHWINDQTYWSRDQVLKFCEDYGYKLISYDGVKVSENV